jgi:hypothetical protein
MKKKKIKSSLFILCLQNEERRITQILHDWNYDRLWLEGFDLSKKMGRYWTIFNANGNVVDSNFKSKEEK